MGYSPWGRKELDTTEQLHFHTFILLFGGMGQVSRNWFSESCINCMFNFLGNSQLLSKLKNYILTVSFLLLLTVIIKVVFS